MNLWKICLCLLAVVLLIPFSGCTVPAQAKSQPAPTALDLSTPPTDIAQALDRIAESNDAQTRALIGLTKQLTGMQGDFSALEARLAKLEQTEQATSGGSSTSSSTASCASGACAVTYSAPAIRYRTAAAEPRFRGVFGGRFAPLKRIGWRLRHPFGGRFRN